MNIANIFGMYLGCMVEALFGPYSYKLYSVNREGGAYVDDLKTDERLYVNLENCKLLLTPLSKITESQKAELRKYCEDNSILPDFAWFTKDAVLYLKNDRVYISCEEGKELALSFKVCMRLAKMGCDIGVVPYESKEIAK